MIHSSQGIMKETLLIMATVWAVMTLPDAGAESPGFLPFASHAYEASAVVALPDGRFLMVEDEEEDPLVVASLNPDRTLTTAGLAADGLNRLGPWDDLEGLTMDAQGRIYAITSHSRSSKGEEKPKREKLGRFRLEGDTLVDVQMFGGLKPLLTQAIPLLATAAQVTDVKNQGGLNIEGLAWDGKKGHLLMGFRSPLDADKALVVRLTQPDALFASPPPTTLSLETATLDLAGFGIRAMTYDPNRDGFWIISGPMAKSTEVAFQLWFWSGQADKAPRHAQVGDLDGVKRGEGLAVTRDGKTLIIVSDDGDRKAQKTSHYLVEDLTRVRLTP